MISTTGKLIEQLPNVNGAFYNLHFSPTAISYSGPGKTTE